MDKEIQELDMALANAEYENRLLRARNDRLEKEMAKLREAITKSLRSLEALSPDSAPIIRILRETVEA